MQNRTNRVSPPPPHQRHHHHSATAGGGRPLVLDEDIHGTSYHRSQINASGVIMRHLDASSTNTTMNGSGVGNGKGGPMWKGSGNNASCKTCGTMGGGCDCGKGKQLSPNTRRQRMNSIQTPYDQAKRTKALDQCQKDEHEHRKFLWDSHHYLMQRTWNLHTHLDHLNQMVAAHSAKAAGLFYFHRFASALDAVEIQESTMRKHIKTERLTWLNKIFPIAEIELCMAEVSTNERYNRYQVLRQEEDYFNTICYALQEKNEFLDECTQQRNRFMKEAFADLGDVRKKEAGRWSKLMEYEVYEQQRQYSDRKLREEFVTESLQRIFILREKQEKKREALRQQRDVEFEHLQDFLRFKKEQQDGLYLDYLTKREEGLMEEQHQRGGISTSMAEDLENVQVVTARKLQQREYLFDEFSEGRNYLMDTEVDQRGLMTLAFTEEGELRQQWVEHKLDERRTFSSHVFVELRAIYVEEEQHFLCLLKNRRDEESLVFRWIEEKRDIRSRYERVAVQELSQIALESHEERRVLLNAMKLQEEQLLEWMQEQGTHIRQFLRAECESRNKIQDKEARQRLRAFEFHDDQLRQIEFYRAAFHAAAKNLEQQHAQGSDTLLAQRIDDMRAASVAMMNDGFRAQERVHLRQQKSFFDAEREDRGETKMEQVKAHAELLVHFESGKEGYEQIREETLRFETEALLHEDKIMRDALQAQWLDLIRLLSAEEHLDHGRALTAQRERQEAELAARQVCLEEDTRLYNDLEEPLPEGRMSTVGARLSMRRSTALVASNNNAGRTSWSFFGGVSAAEKKAQEEEELEMKKNFILSVMPHLEPHILTMRRCELDAFAAVLEATVEFTQADTSQKRDLELMLSREKKRVERQQAEVKLKLEVANRYEMDKQTSKKKHQKQMSNQREENMKNQAQVKVEKDRKQRMVEDLKKAKNRHAILQEHCHQKLQGFK